MQSRVNSIEIYIKQSRVNKIQRYIAKERSLKFYKKAKVRLKVFKFPLKYPKEINQGNVKRLKDILYKRYYQLEAKNQVLVVINTHDLQNVITRLRITLNKLIDNPKEVLLELKFPSNFHLKYLYGKYCI